MFTASDDDEGGSGGSDDEGTGGGGVCPRVDCVRVVVTADAFDSRRNNTTGSSSMWKRLLDVCLRAGCAPTVATVTSTIDVHLKIPKKKGGGETKKKKKDEKNEDEVKEGKEGCMEVLVGQRVKVAPWVPPLPRIGLRLPLLPTLNQVVAGTDCYPWRVLLLLHSCTFDNLLR